MPPAHKSRLKRLKNGKRSKRFAYKKLLIFIFFLIIGCIIFLRSIHFRGFEKLSLVTQTREGDIIVTVFDKKAEKITNIKIPGDTEVNVSSQLGTWRLKSVWQLGVHEGKTGSLLASTVIKNFKFPIQAWAETQGMWLIGDDLLNKIKSLVIPYDTNLGIGDKLSLAIFSLTIKNFDRVEINLADSSYLKKTKLKDGSEGYEVTEKLPQNLIVVFADSLMEEKETRIVIRNASGAKVLSSEIAKVLEVLGGKVVANIEETEDDIDCEISTKSDEIAQLISSVINCSLSNNNPEGNFDLEVKIGRKFFERF